MSYDFFFSYPRMEWNAYLKKFYDDLHAAVKRLRGVTTDCGFRDREDIVRGSDWEKKLLDALQTSRTIVAIYCPAYFNRDVCLKELRIFQQRQNAFLTADAANAELPHAMKPIKWIAPFTAPPDLAPLQYDTHNDEFFTARGLSYFLQTASAAQKNKYRKFVNDLALDIVKTAAAIDLPQLAKLPSLLADDPFDAAPAQPGRDDDGPDHVKFVYIAPTSNLAVAMGRQDYYGSHGRAWKPFLPNFVGQIGALAQRVAGEYNFTSDELTFSAKLPDAVRDAETQRNVVVILMDGWAVEMPDCAKVVRELDKMHVPNCGVLVPWASDEKTAQARERLTTAVRRALWRWVGEANPARFNDSIIGETDFRERLAEGLTRLRNAVLMAPDPNGPLLPGPPKPTITNTLG